MKGLLSNLNLPHSDTSGSPQVTDALASAIPVCTSPFTTFHFRSSSRVVLISYGKLSFCALSSGVIHISGIGRSLVALAFNAVGLYLLGDVTWLAAAVCFLSASSCLRLMFHGWRSIASTRSAAASLRFILCCVLAEIFFSAQHAFTLTFQLVGDAEYKSLLNLHIFHML